MPTLCRSSVKDISGCKASESCHLRLIHATPASLVMRREDRLHAPGRKMGKENGKIEPLQRELGKLLKVSKEEKVA